MKEIFIAIGLIAAIFMAVHSMKRNECRIVGERNMLVTQWDGEMCHVEYNGVFVPLDWYKRNVDDLWSGKPQNNK